MRASDSYVDSEALHRTSWTPGPRTQALRLERLAGDDDPRPGGSWTWLLLVAVPLAVTGFRLLPLPIAQELDAALDLTTLPAGLLTHVQNVLLVPVGALVVVVFRLTLGVRALGVLSPVLLGVALPSAGLLPGLSFLVVAVGVSALFVRPVLRAHGLPFSARVAALLSIVAILMLLPLLVLRQTPGAHPEAFALLPPVALGLVTERFASTAHREGVATASGRTLLTCVEAVAIGWVGTGLGAVHLLARHPELLLVQVWAVMVVSTRLSPRLVERHLAPRVTTWWRARRPSKGSSR
jgi:hypothetical protein